MPRRLRESLGVVEATKRKADSIAEERENGEWTGSEAERRLWRKYVGIQGAGGKEVCACADSLQFRIHAMFMVHERCV